MARYFKVTEIDRDTFIQTVGCDLDCAQFINCAAGIAYVAIDDAEEDELQISLDLFDEEE